MRLIPCKLALVVTILLAAAPAAEAQRMTLTTKSYTDSENGYRLRYPVEWEVVPIQPELRSAGLLFKVEPRRDEPWGGELLVIRLEPDRKVEQSSTRRGVDQVLGVPPFSYRGFDQRRVVVDESLKIKRIAARHQRWSVRSGWVDTWTLHLDEYDVCLVYVVHQDDSRADSWLRLYSKSARTFERVERTERLVLEDAENYEDMLAYYAAETARTPGWRALGTPSEDFVLKTNSDNRRFIEAVIDRLERSRAVFEGDFPPPSNFDHVSVVRLCNTEEEFHQYTNTGPGAAGWFNPSTTELVLYDAVAIDRNMSFAVMSHEAFHQYCYFLFDRSEAHRWFDEGHGDYYGSFKFKGRKAQVTAKMPGGLERYSGIRQMIREETYAPLGQHLNFSHGEWQSQGPRNVSPYEQSWSLIYMLRQGSLGKVPRKVWREEYAEILPNYMTTLNSGFARAYADQVDKVLLEAEERDEEPTEAELHAAATEVDEEVKRAIWDEAMSASWGQIDLAEFEQHWLLYVAKYLKD